MFTLSGGTSAPVRNPPRSNGSPDAYCVLKAILWLSAHLPFVMSFVLYGGALSRLVVAHDSPDADETNLTEVFAQKSEGELSPGLRWFYCAGLAIALICMGKSVDI